MGVAVFYDLHQLSTAVYMPNGQTRWPEEVMLMSRGIYPTGSGMHGLWVQSAFSVVCDYESWERELLNDKDIERHIANGHFIPLNIGADGAMEIEIRCGNGIDAAVLSDREKLYLVVSSEPYRLHASGPVCVSGIEYVAVPPESGVGTVAVPPGEYAVTVHLIAWDEEPGMMTEDGPAPGALPDFVVLVNPANSEASYRLKVQTFDR